MKTLLCLALLLAVLAGGLSAPTLAGVWGLWNDPPATQPVIAPQKDESREQLMSARERAAEKKRLALEAMRRLEQARRAAKEAEAEQLAEETSYNNQQEYERLQRRAARERDAAEQARQDKAALQRTRTRTSAASPDYAAASTQDSAGLSQLMAEQQEAEALIVQKQKELERLKELAAQKQVRAQAAREQAEQERLRKIAAEEQQRAELERLRQMAAEEQRRAELERLRQMAAREREEARKIQEQAELERLRQMAAREREEAEKIRRQEELALAPSPAISAPSAPQGTAAAPMQAAPSTGAVQGAGNDYLLGPGDVLDVSVWKDESLSRTVMVTPDGAVSLPLIGKIKAAGRSLNQLKTELEQRLAVYVPDPVLSLDVKQANSMQIYIIGKVNSPGRYVISSNINVIQALAMAGGLNPFADQDDIRIMREQAGGDTRSFDFNYKKVLRGDNLEQNIRLQRGDVIVVP